MTRSTTRLKLLDDFSKCTVRITKKPYFDQLLRTQRSAKIIARRCTVAVDNSVSHSVASGQSALFKKVTNKPFINRRKSVCSQNITRAVAATSSNQSIPIVQQPPTNNFGVDRSSSEPSNIENVSLIDIDDGQFNVSSLEINGNSVQPKSAVCIFDSVVPDNLPIPLVPVQIGSILDVPVSDDPTAILLPQRSVPDLIPISNRTFKANLKQYTGGSGRRSGAAQFILDSLEKYEKQVVDDGFDDSGEDFGRLVYSDSE